MGLFSSDIKTMDDLFVHTMKDIYYAENQILKALPKMARGAQSEDLKAAFRKHAEETDLHVQRLEQVFEELGRPARGKTCPAIDGIIEEGEEVMEAFKGTPALDAGLVAAAQAVEHYEIARYGTLAQWAKDMGRAEVASLLERSLQEEKQADAKLSQIAEGGVNKAAGV